MKGIDLIGAGEGLSTQTIMVRIKSIDTAKFRKSLGEVSWGGAISPALSTVDQFPKLALDMVMPIAKDQLEKIGITTDLSVTNAPPPPRPPAETKAALLVGTVFGVLLAIGARWAYRRVTKKE